VEGSTLTCNLHGWEWNLQTGRCLTSKGHELRSERTADARSAEVQ
jgi:UDP-MurNAc hydroxylase